MKIIISTLVYFILITVTQIKASDFKDVFNDIEVRKTAMQNIWYRVKRLSPYVELKEKVDYNKELATNDAEEIISLLEKTKLLWSEKSNLSAKGFTNATPAVWALPDYFDKLYSSAELSASNLKNAIINDEIDGTVVAMCNLGNACGTFTRTLEDC